MHHLPDRLQALMRRQDGVADRRQLIELGHGDADIRRWRRQRLLTPVLDGVYVNHTGRPTWLQRAWAACLYAEPAALAGRSALRAAQGPGRRDHDDAGPIEVAVEHGRRHSVVAGVVVRRVRGLDERVLWNLGPPRLKPEEAVIDEAAAAGSDHGAVAVIASAVGARLTTAPRLAEALSRRNRVARRAFLAGVLGDVGQGAHSVLEHEYLCRVERAHGLPAGRRQAPGSSHGRIFRDVGYDEHGVWVELDGRLDHTDAADVDRDLDGAVEGRTTVRLGWGQVVGRPCRTALRVGRLLQLGGWQGEPTRCPDCA